MSNPPSAFASRGLHHPGIFTWLDFVVPSGGIPGDDICFMCLRRQMRERDNSIHALRTPGTGEWGA
jgi:hypothetical protein